MVVATQRPPVPAITTRDVDRLTSSVDGLQTIVRELKEIIVGRPDLDRQYPISSTYAYVLDYRDRFFVYLFAPVALTLSIEDYGTLAVLANNWTLLPFQLGTRIFATNITGAGIQQNMLIRCTDRYISSYSSTSGLAASVNIAQFGGVTTQMYTADGVAYANVPEVGIGINTGSNVTRLLSAGGQAADASNASGILPNAPYIYNGATWDRARTPNVFKLIQAVSVTAGTPVSVWTPAVGKKFRMMGFNLATTVAASILMEDATGGANEFYRVPLLVAATPFASPPLGNGRLSSTANNSLFIDVTVTGIVSGVIYGTEE